MSKLNAEVNPVHRYDQCVRLIKSVIGELRTTISSYNFRDGAEEISYFKTLAPPFYSEHFYYSKLLTGELHRLSGTKEDRKSFQEQELQEIGRFFLVNGDFIRYHYSGSTGLDEKYFTRGAAGFWTPDEIADVLDQLFCLGSYKLSRLLGYERYRSWLETEIRLSEDPQAGHLNEFSGKVYGFEGTNSDAGEWITSFSNLKLITINGQPADTKTLAQLFELIFARKLGNIYDIQHTNRNRKKDPTPFLNSLLASMDKKS